MLTVQADPESARAVDTLQRTGFGVRWQIGAVTDRGVVRRENQDGWALTSCGDDSFALLLADGMGGHAGGAIAARLALEHAAALLAEAAAPRDALAAAFGAADAAVAADGLDGSGGGTTLVAAVLSGRRCRVAHIGDSRAYILRAATAAALTNDHTWVAEQERAGLLTAAQAAVHPQRNLLTRAVTGDGMQPDLTDLELTAGEVLLLCSDGLWGSVTEATLSALVAAADLAAGLAALVDAAIAGGSTDNVTALGARLAATG
ncbi:MAG: PP2C family serine/threonine-protein phosphatase [Candidatus Dormibacteria bacterium]